MPFPSKVVTKYLEKHAQTYDIEALRCLNISDVCVCVPVFDEDPQTLEHLLNSISNAAENKGCRGLVLFVLNQRQNSSIRVSNQNKETLEWLKVRFQDESFPLEGLGFVGKRGPLTAVVVDHFSQPELQYSKERGVGLARKVACDLAVRLYDAGKIVSQSIYITDADAVVPIDYFQQMKPGMANAVFEFVHDGDQSVQLYDRYLKHYRDGLKLAGSPYAFCTVGSTIVTDVRTYCSVRGFPKNKLAGEDFYYLNKAHKVSPVVTLQGSPIHLSGRRSDRTPFGTGQAVTKIDNEGGWKFHSSEAFEWLGRWLQFAQGKLSEACLSPIGDVLQNSGCLDVLVRARKSSPDASQQLKQFHHHFDALKTLKWIHCWERRNVDFQH